MGGQYNNQQYYQEQYQRNTLPLGNVNNLDNINYKEEYLKLQAADALAWSILGIFIFVFSIPAFFISKKALKQGNKRKSVYAGLVISVIRIVLFILSMVLGIAIASLTPNSYMILGQ